MSKREFSHPVFSRLYLRTAEAMDRRGAAEHRRRLLDGLSGQVVEVGAGSGRNFAHYPEAVTEVVAVEPEPRLRAEAELAAARAPVPVRVVEGYAGTLQFDDASFDAGVVSLVLCSVPDPVAALAELYRVIRAAGELRFYEHVAAETGPLAIAQRFVDATFWPLLLAGCHTHRPTLDLIEAAGFEAGGVARFRFPRGLPHPAAPHILGVAIRSSRADAG